VPGPEAISITNAATHTAITSALAARMSKLRRQRFDYAPSFPWFRTRASQGVGAERRRVAGRREGHRDGGKTEHGEKGGEA
jgi:hypothetical protein